MLWFSTKQNALLYALSIQKSGLLDIQGSDNLYRRTCVCLI